MPTSSTVTLKDDSGNALYPKTIGSAVTIYRGGEANGTPITLQAVVDQLPNFEPSETGSVTGKTVTLSTTGAAVIQINGVDNGTVALPSVFTVPVGWTVGSITGEGKITANTSVQSGNKLVICNNSNEIKKSSIEFGSDNTKYLRNDGTWQKVSTITPKYAVGDYVIVNTDEQRVDMNSNEEGRTYSVIEIDVGRAPQVNGFTMNYYSAYCIDNKVLIINSMSYDIRMSYGVYCGRYGQDPTQCSKVYAPERIIIPAGRSILLTIDVLLYPNGAKAETYIGVITVDSPLVS